MRLRAAWLVVVLGLLAGSAEATPFTFEFDLPWGATTPLYGTSGILFMTVDNNGSSAANQTYRFQDVTALQASVVGGTYPDILFTSADMGSGCGAVTLLTTNASAAGSITTSSACSFIQGTHAVAFETGVVGFEVLSVKGSSEVAVVAPDAGLLQSTASASVPEPATLMLLSFGVVGLGVYRRRRRS